MFSGSGGWRLRARPALDGLRGVAVLMVVVSHVFRFGDGPPALILLGHAGVTIFFVLSRFLITSLLLEELSSTGRISLAAFYARRTRRLAPALLAMLAVVLVLGLTIRGYSNWPVYIGALTWSANWIAVAQKSG